MFNLKSKPISTTVIWRKKGPETTHSYYLVQIICTIKLVFKLLISTQKEWVFSRSTPISHCGKSGPFFFGSFSELLHRERTHQPVMVAVQKRCRVSPTTTTSTTPADKPSLSLCLRNETPDVKAVLKTTDQLCRLVSSPLGKGSSNCPTNILLNVLKRPFGAV